MSMSAISKTVDWYNANTTWSFLLTSADFAVLSHFMMPVDKAIFKMENGNTAEMTAAGGINEPQTQEAVRTTLQAALVGGGQSAAVAYDNAATLVKYGVAKAAGLAAQILRAAQAAG